MTGAESLSLNTQPVTEIPSTLSLSGGGVAGISPQKGSDETLARPQGKTFPSRRVHVDLIEIRQETA